MAGRSDPSRYVPPSSPLLEGIRIVRRRRRAGAFLLCRLHIYAFSMNNFYAKSEQVAQFTLVKRETRLASSAAADVAGLGNCCSIKVASTCRRGCNRCRERRGRGSSSGINLSTRPCLALHCLGSRSEAALGEQRRHWHGAGAPQGNTERERGERRGGGEEVFPTVAMGWQNALHLNFIISLLAPIYGHGLLGNLWS